MSFHEWRVNKLDIKIMHVPRTAYSLWSNGKLEIQYEHPETHFQIFLEEANRN